MKTILITGTSRGIGLATAKRFLDEGWFVIGTTVSGNVPLHSENLAIIDLDLRSAESIAHATSEIAKLNKKIDVLFNNAGALFDENEAVVKIDLLRKTLEVNLISLIDFTERIIPLMPKSGHIINTSSQAGGLGGQLTGLQYPAYRISKTAVNMYTKTLAARLAPEGIMVSSLDPGWVRTDMGGDEAPRMPEEAANDVFELANRKNPSGRFWRFGNEREW